MIGQLPVHGFIRLEELFIGPLIECAAAVGLDFFNYNTEEHTMREGFVILGVFCVLVGGILYFALYH